jgi:predicted MFS family arabinose efflux permease
MDVAMNVWAAEVEKAHARPIMSAFHAMFSLGAGLGAALGYFAIRAGISVAAHLATASALLACITLGFALIPWQSARSDTKGGSVFAFPKGPLIFVGLVALAAAMGEGAVADWGAIFLNGTIRTTEAQAVLGYSIFSVAIFVSRMIGDTFVRRFGPVQAARASGLAAFIGVLIVVSGNTLTQTLIGFAVMGLGYAILFPLAFSRAASDPYISPGRGIASVATLGYGGLLLGPPLIGFLAELSSLRMSFAVLALMAGMIVAFAPHLRRTED